MYKRNLTVVSFALVISGLVLLGAPNASADSHQPDATPPTISVSTPHVGATYTTGSEVTADFTCSDAVVQGQTSSGIASCQGLLKVVLGPGVDGPPPPPQPISTGDPLDLSRAGDYTLEVTATDQAGLVARDDVTFTVTGPPAPDEVAPEITIDAPVDGSYVRQGATVNAAYMCTDAASVPRCDGPVESGQPIETETLGERTFRVEAEDAAGNTSSRSVTYRVIPVEAVVVSGVLTDPSGEPVVGGSVEARLTGSSENDAMTRSGSGGRYTLALRAGTYDFRVRGPAGSGLAADVTSRNISGDATLDLVLQRYQVNVTVELRDARGQVPESGYVGVSTAEGASLGTFSVYNGSRSLTLQAGAYQFYAFGVSTVAGRQEFYTVTDHVVLDEDQTISLVPDTSEVSLSVYDHENQPVNIEQAKLWCDLSGSETERIDLWVDVVSGLAIVPILTDPDATCTFAGTAGDLQVVRKFSGGLPGVDIQLAEPVTVAGRLIDPFRPGEMGMDRGHVSLYSSDPERPLNVTDEIDYNGDYSITIEPQEDLLISAGGNTGNPETYISHSEPISVTQDMTRQLRPSVVGMTVRLRDTGGGPVSGSVRVGCVGENQPVTGAQTQLSYTASVDGDAQLWGLHRTVNEACQITASAEERPDTNEWYTPPLDGTGMVTIAFPETVYVEGKVSGPATSPTLTEPANVTAYDSSFRQPVGGRTDAAGNFRLLAAAGTRMVFASGSAGGHYFNVMSRPFDPADGPIDVAPEGRPVRVHLRQSDGSPAVGSVGLQCGGYLPDSDDVDHQTLISRVDQASGSVTLPGMGGEGWNPGGVPCRLEISAGGAAVVKAFSVPEGGMDVVFYAGSGRILDPGTNASEDEDNVSDYVEALAPHNGDGNQDGTPDYLQDHVTSLPINGTDASGDRQFITLATEEGVKLGNVSTMPLSAIDNAPPAGVELPEGLVNFRLDGIDEGSTHAVTIHTQATGLTGYAKYHDGEWAVLDPNLVTIDEPAGTVTVTLTDGGAGDDDGTENGSILDPGGPAVVTDQDAPVITIDGPADGQSFVLGDEPPRDSVICTANDASPLEGDCEVTVTGGNANGVGTWTIRATARDVYGNAAVEERIYSVRYGFSGFLQPLNDPTLDPAAVLSVFKAGSTVPVRLRLTRADGSVVIPVEPPEWATPVKGSSLSLAVNEPVSTLSATSGEDFRLVDGKWQYNWATSKSAGGFRYRIGVVLDDGTTRWVTVGLR